jgi:hypothetical protein
MRSPAMRSPAMRSRLMILGRFRQIRPILTHDHDAAP